MGHVALRPLTKLRPEQVTGAALMLVAVATSPPILGGFAPNASAFGWVGMLLFTAMVTVPLRMWALRAEAAPAVLAKLMVGGFLAGWANSVLCFVAASPPGDHLQAIVVAPIVAIIGFPVGGAVGLGYGVLFIVPMLLAHAHQHRPSAERADACLFGVGVWAAAVSIGFGLLALAEGGLALPPGPARLMLVLLLLMASAALAMTVLALKSLLRRRVWLRRVRAGRVPNWVVVPLEAWSGAELDRVEPLLAGALADGVLAEISQGEAGYRRARRLRPWALVRGA